MRADHRLPTATAMLVYKVGSVDDPAGSEGMAHFMEHMVFRGTGKYRSGEIDRATLRLGGDNNAYTTKDVTGYWFRVTPGHLDQALDILAETMGSCTLEDQDLAIERGPVLEEMNLWLDEAWGHLNWAQDRLVFPRAGYAHPILGIRESVERITRTEMLSFYRTYYIPNNATLVLLGDVDEAVVLAQVDRVFGHLLRGADIRRNREETYRFAPDRKTEVTLDRAPDRFIMAFLTEPLGAEDSFALELLAVVLGEGRSSRLKKRLVTKDALASDSGIAVSQDALAGGGVFSIRVVFGRDGSMEDAKSAVGDEIRKLTETLLSPRELRRAKNIFRSRFAFELQAQKELAWRIGTDHALGVPRLLEETLPGIEGVSAEDLREVARKTLCPENRMILWGSGRDQASRSRARAARNRCVRPGRWECFPRSLMSEDPPQLAPVRRGRLPNGLRIVVQPRHELPIVTIRADVDAGPLHDPEGREGLAELVARMLDRGTQEDSGVAGDSKPIFEEVEFLGGTYGVSPTEISVNLMSNFWTNGLDLLRDVLRSPRFSAQRFNRVREQHLADLEGPDDGPEDVARREFFKAAYRGHRLAYPPMGRKDAVASLELNDVCSFYSQFYRPENVVIAVVGDISPDRVFEELGLRFQEWKGEGDRGPGAVSHAIRQTRPRFIEHGVTTRQTRIHIGHVGISRGNPDYYTLRVLETILGFGPGFSHRLGKRLREELGLVYDVSGSITPEAGLAEGPFLVVLGIDERHRDRALEAVGEVLREFREKGPLPEEVEDAKQYLLRSFGSDWETLEDTADYLTGLERFALGTGYSETFRDAIARVTRDDVHRAARAYIDPACLTTVIVRPRGLGDYAVWGIVASTLLAGGTLFRLSRRKRQDRSSRTVDRIVRTSTYGSHPNK